jgi:hypothetical protein
MIKKLRKWFTSMDNVIDISQYLDNTRYNMNFMRNDVFNYTHLTHNERKYLRGDLRSSDLSENEINRLRDRDLY